MAEFVTVQHPDVKGTAVVARTALPYLDPRWRVVGDPVPVPGVEASQYDPGAHTVDEVNDYLDENPGDIAAVLRREESGQARKGVLEGRHAG